MKAADLAELLAPEAPPCFSSQELWVSYVRSAAAAHHAGDAPGPLVFTRGVIAVNTDTGLETADTAPAAPPFLVRKGKTVKFNPALDFCDECASDFRAAKAAKGLCKPDHLKTLFHPKGK